MPVTSTSLHSVTEYSPGCYKLEMDHDMFVTYRLVEPDRIVIRRHNRVKGHFHILPEPPDLDNLGPEILAVVNYLLAEKMLPYARTRRKSYRPHDTQRESLYKAERTLDGFGDALIPDLFDVQMYVNKIVQSAWWLERYPNVTYIDVKESVHHGKPAKRGRAYPKQRVIRLPPFARHPLYILHEMAHIVEDPDEVKNTASHGPEFCADYLYIVRQVMGDERADMLQSRMDWNKVKYC